MDKKSSGLLRGFSRKKSFANDHLTLSSSHTVSVSDHMLDSDLDFELDQWDSHAMLRNLGDSPSSQELDSVVAVRAKEYIEECLFANISVLDQNKWDSIPQFTKMNLVVGQHLGRGTFSDVFRVFAKIAEDEEAPTIESLDSDRVDLDKLIEAKFGRGPNDEDRKHNTETTDAEIGTMSRSSYSGASTDILEEDEFGKKEEVGDDLDKEIDVMFSYSPRVEPSRIRKGDARHRKQDEVEKPKEFQPRTSAKSSKTVRRRITDLNGSVCVGSQSRSSSKTKKGHGRELVLAMKCLRPKIQTNAKQFMIGVEDLVHETDMLASLDHPNIVKIHGRAGGGCVSNSIPLSDGFFILLDLLKDTLEDRIHRWKKTSSNKKAPPSLIQIKVACSIANAMAYLHSKKIIFRDLKPANIGFDSMGVLKLFDFGFSIGIGKPPRSSSICSGNSGKNQESHLLYDKCGTPRYMAPEVGLEMGYSLPADVYSFGIVLWEICALKKPFGDIKSVDGFKKAVFEKGARPNLGKHWPLALKSTISTCWSVSEMERPTMQHVKSMLTAHAREVSIQQNVGQDNLRKSSVFRRFTGAW